MADLPTSRAVGAGGRHVYWKPWFNFTLAAAVGVSGVIRALVPGIQEVEAGQVAWGLSGIALGLGGLYVAVRIAICSVTANRDGLVARNFVWTTKIPWRAIDHFEFGRKDPYPGEVGI